MSYDPTTFNSASGSTNVIAALRTTESNTSGSQIDKATPVKITPNGIRLISVSSESDVHAAIGVTKQTIADLATGEVVYNGKIEDVSIVGDIGQALYISKDGTLTITKPDIGVIGFVSGDWVVRVGIITKNYSNPFVKDLLVNINIIGQLA